MFCGLGSGCRYLIVGWQRNSPLACWLALGRVLFLDRAATYARLEGEKYKIVPSRCEIVPTYIHYVLTYLSGFVPHVLV